MTKPAYPLLFRKSITCSFFSNRPFIFCRSSPITKAVADFALDILDVDRLGLDNNDRTILLTMIQKFGGGPVGLETLAASIGEDSGTLEDVYEPYLLMNGLINRTPRGRVATEAAYVHLGIPADGGEA